MKGLPLVLKVLALSIAVFLMAALNPALSQGPRSSDMGGEREYQDTASGTSNDTAVVIGLLAGLMVAGFVYLYKNQQLSEAKKEIADLEHRLDRVKSRLWKEVASKEGWTDDDDEEEDVEEWLDDDD